MVRRLRANLVVSKGKIDVTDLEIEIRLEVRNTELDVAGWGESGALKGQKVWASMGVGERETTMN